MRCSQLALFDASTGALDASPEKPAAPPVVEPVTPSDRNDEPIGPGQPSWNELLRRQTAYLESRFEHQRQAGLKRRAQQAAASDVAVDPLRVGSVH